MTTIASTLPADPGALLGAMEQWNALLAREPDKADVVPAALAADRLWLLAQTAVDHKLWLIADHLLARLLQAAPANREARKLADKVRNLKSMMYVQVGQLQPESSMSVLIRKIVAEMRPRVILDVGAAAGLGTTRIFAEAVAAAGVSCTIYAIESQPETYELLVANTRGYACVTPVLTSLVGPDVLPPWDAVRDEVTRRSPDLHQRFPGQIELWYRHGVDLIASLAREGKAPAVGLPTGLIDMAMIDADLFFAREELAAIIGRTNVVFLDDVHGYKNDFNHEWLAAHPDWRLLQHDPADRHGWSAFARKTPLR